MRHGVHRSPGIGEERPLLEARPPVETTQPEGDVSGYHRKHPGCPAGPVTSGYEVHSAPDIVLRVEDVRYRREGWRLPDGGRLVEFKFHFHGKFMFYR